MSETMKAAHLLIGTLLLVASAAADQTDARKARLETELTLLEEQRTKLKAELALLEEQRTKLEADLASTTERIDQVQSDLDHVLAEELRFSASTSVSVVLDEDDIALFQQPSLYEARIGALSSGDKIEIVGCNGEGFWQAMVGDQVGWIHESAKLAGEEKRLRIMWLACFNRAAEAQAEANRRAIEIQAEEERHLAELKATKEELEAELRLMVMVDRYGSANGQKVAERQIWIGMTSNMARDSWGRPKDINRTVTADGVHQQWVYDHGRILYFDNGILTSWQD